MIYNTTQESSDANCCTYLHYQESTGTYHFYKYCSNPNKFKEYTAAFQLEYEHMERLRRLMAAKNLEHTYLQLFPQYYPLPEKYTGNPYLRIEYIPGKSLEDLLAERRSHNGPYHLLTHKQILHIFEQLYQAISWLYKGGMFQFDLSPQNILLINEDYDIRLIDFTNCYYTDFSLSENIERGYKKIDYRLDSKLPLSQQLRDSCALLFTRLFFSGNKDYNNWFSTNPRNTNTKTNRYFFEQQYPQLLNCLFYPESSTAHVQDNHPLADWENWYEKLRKLLLSFY